MELRTFEYTGGGHVSGRTSHDIVDMMRRDSHTPTKNIQEFMEQTAERCNIQRGSHIRTDSTRAFVDDLIASGFLKEL